MDPVPVLAYAAAVTERILLGTGIVILPLRNPVILAKELATVDVLSQGRLDGRHRRRVRAGRVRGDRGAVRHPGPPRRRMGRRRCAPSGATSSPSSGVSSRRSAASSAARSRTVPAVRRSWPAGCRRRPGGGPSPGARAGTASSRTSTTPAPASTSSTASPRRSTAPPSSASSRSPSRRVPGPIDLDTVRRYEDLGVDRLVILQDFGDMAGGPDAARRGKFLDEMTACAERLDIH